MLGVGLGSLMGGAIFVEVIFARTGLGTMIYDAIQARNYPIVHGGVLVVAVLFVLANLVADLSSASSIRASATRRRADGDRRRRRDSSRPSRPAGGA